MINLFQASIGDKSLEYLRTIFGPMNGIIYDPSIVDRTTGQLIDLGDAGGSITLLGQMFKTFNSVVLTVAVWIVVYVTVVGIVMTAHEGEFMGKKWNNIWLPIRTVMGIAMLVPTASGYCFLQMVMMWVIVQGIGAADNLWTTALRYVNVVGSPYGQLTIPSITASQAIHSLFNNLVCNASFAEKPLSTPPDQPSQVDKYYYCGKDPSDSFCSASPPTIPGSSGGDTITVSFGPNGVCGTMNMCDQTTVCSAASADTTNTAKQIACAACKAQTTAMTQIVPTLYTIAQKLVSADHQYYRWYGSSGSEGGTSAPDFVQRYCSDNNIQNCCVQSSLVAFAEKYNLPAPQGLPTCAPADQFPKPSGENTQNASQEATQMYYKFVILPNYGENYLQASVNRLVDDITKAVSDYIKGLLDNKTELDDTLSEAQKLGWIFAGGYYYGIANRTANNLENAVPQLTVNRPDQQGSKFTGNRNNYQTAAKLEGGSGRGPLGDNMTSVFGPAFTDTIDSGSDAFVANTKPGGSNALSAVMTIGRIMIVIAEIAYPVIILVIIAMGIPACLDVFVLGTGVENPTCDVFQMLLFVLVPAFYALLGYMITIGAMLGIYVPLIPYTIFTFGAIGWMISTVETMVAGPLVALGILSPSGQHELLGKAEPALMLLFNVFLRPSLMIFGLMAAMLISSAVITMINFSFSLITQDLGLYDPLGFIIFMAAYVMIIVTALNKSFQAISIIPERVMRWVSGQAEQYGEAEAVGEAKGGVTAGAGTSRGAFEAGRGKASSGREMKRKAAMEKKQEEEKNKLKLSQKP